MFPERLVPRRRAFLAAAGGVAAGIVPVSAATEFDTSRGVAIAVVGHGFVGEMVRTGALLKIEQLNAAGGILGSNVRLIDETAKDPPSDIRTDAIDTARRVVDVRGLIGVIGHDSVEDALPAGITYYTAGIPFITTTITSTGLTLHGLTNLFATLPDNAEISTQTARIVFDIGLRRAVIVRDRSASALEISLAYRNESAVLGIPVVEERSLPKGSSPRDYLAGLQGMRFDHLLIIAEPDLQVSLVKFASEFGLNVTCVFPTMTNIEIMRQKIGRVIPRVLLPVLRARDAPTPTQAEWDRQHNARFGVHPEDLSMQGTDAVGVLAAGLKRVGFFDLAELRRVLHGELAYPGVCGPISFRSNGRIYTRLLGFASIRPNEVAYYMPGA
jgi:branched-chain amino acid transport system substrate-binding protein